MKEPACNGDSMLVYSFSNYLIEDSLNLFILELKYNRLLIFLNKDKTNSPSSFFFGYWVENRGIYLSHSETNTFI